ncbi:hypothetical protein PENSPDRAFT_757536 [Peniophora sp. CONT]|nr:hypothetical protein PENSPDRAFT_757536 [Peniophora sp. CONT]
MFSTKLVLFVCMAVAGSSVNAAPNPYKRETATPALAAREPQFSVNIPNNIPVSGAFLNGITITPGTPSGSIVTGNRNSTLFGQFGFKRDDATPVLAAREPQFSVNIPNTIPVSGNFPNGINLTPGTPSGSIVTSTRNSTFPFNLFGRDDDPRQPLWPVLAVAPDDKIIAALPNPATPTLDARAPQFSVNIPNTIPVSGSFPNGINITPGTPSGSIVTGNRNSTLFGQFGFKRDDATPVLAAREPQFSVNIPNNIPVSGSFPNGINITPGTPSGSIVTGNRNSTLFGQFGFKREDATPALAAREPQFSVNIPNNIPVSGSLPNGISITPGTPSGSIVTDSRNGTFPFNLFGRDL